MPSPGEVQRGPGPSAAWMISCGALCTAILAYGLLGYKEVVGDLAYQAGYNFPIALVLAGVLHFAFRRRETSTTSWLGFLLVYISLLAASYFSAQRLKGDIRESVAQVQETLSALQEATSAGTAAPAPKPVMATGTSEGAKMGALLQTMVNRMLAHRRDYELELEAIGWSGILDGKRLKTDPNLATSRAMLQQANAIVAKYKQRNASIFTAMRQDIEQSDLSSGSRTSMLAGFDSTLEQGKAQALELWALEEAALGEFQKIIDLLSTRRSAWQIEDDQIMFQAQSDLDTFNSHVSVVQSIVAKQEALQAAAIQRSKDTLDQVTR